VIKRANMFGVKGFLFAAGFIEDAKIALTLCEKTPNSYATIGVHPTRASQTFKEGATGAEKTTQMKSYFE